MAEVTYWFDVRYINGSEWENDPAYMVDNILTNYASTASDGDIELLIETTGPGTDLGTITKIELRVYGYGDGDDRIDLYFQPLGDPDYQLTMPTSPGWSAYADVTADSHINGWTWTKVQALNPYTLKIEFDKVGKGNTMHCAKVEIRVTYTPLEAKTTQYLAGLDCPPFPHSKDLLSSKLPCALPWN